MYAAGQGYDVTAESRGAFTIAVMIEKDMSPCKAVPGLPASCHVFSMAL
jgi:hypothetical protein